MENTTQAIAVTSEWITTYIATHDKVKVANMVGRALVALYDRQTADEKASDSTSHLNSVGFSGVDAEIGSSMAKWVLSGRYLSVKQVEVWTKPGKNGLPRLCKYARQLNEIAQAKKG